MEMTKSQQIIHTNIEEKKLTEPSNVSSNVENIKIKSIEGIELANMSLFRKVYDIKLNSVSQIETLKTKLKSQVLSLRESIKILFPDVFVKQNASDYYNDIIAYCDSNSINLSIQLIKTSDMTKLCYVEKEIIEYTISTNCVSFLPYYGYNVPNTDDYFDEKCELYRDLYNKFYEYINNLNNLYSRGQNILFCRDYWGQRRLPYFSITEDRLYKVSFVLILKSINKLIYNKWREYNKNWEITIENILLIEYNTIYEILLDYNECLNYSDILSINSTDENKISLIQLLIVFLLKKELYKHTNINRSRYISNLFIEYENNFFKKCISNKHNLLRQFLSDNHFTINFGVCNSCNKDTNVVYCDRDEDNIHIMECINCIEKIYNEEVHTFTCNCCGFNYHLN